MKPEILTLDLRVMTPRGSGRLMPFFDEDPDIVVCPAAAPNKAILCRIKLDESNDLVEFDILDVKSMPYA